jgi:hypothetical protein
MRAAADALNSGAPHTYQRKACVSSNSLTACTLRSLRGSRQNPERRRQ